MNKLSIKNENIYIPLLFTGVLSVTSFVPLFQILLLNLSGAIYYPFDLLFDNQLSPYFYLIFGFFTVCSLFLFYKTKSTSWKYLSSFATVVFLFPIITFSLEFVETETFWFLPFLIASIGCEIALLLVGLLKQASSSITSVSSGLD